MISANSCPSTSESSVMRTGNDLAVSNGAKWRRPAAIVKSERSEAVTPRVA
jgi:hypothetical protein